MAYQQNPDRVTPPVVSGGGVGLVLAVLVRSLIDRYADPADRELWWNVFQAALFLLPLVGAVLAARFKARNQVTPIPLSDVDDVTPRNRAGERLVTFKRGGVVDPERLAEPEERPRRRPPTTNFP